MQLFSPIEGRTKTNHDLHNCIFPAQWHFEQVMCNIASNCDWFTVLFELVMIGQSNFFGFALMTVNLKLLHWQTYYFVHLVIFCQSHKSMFSLFWKVKSLIPDKGKFLYSSFNPEIGVIYIKAMRRVDHITKLEDYKLIYIFRQA